MKYTVQYVLEFKLYIGTYIKYQHIKAPQIKLENKINW